MAGGGISKETQMSIEASTMFPGFRFSPTDAELISYYLKKKIEGADKCVEVISEVEICNHEPWDLPGKAVIQSDTEWFFFSARGRKYPNGTQSRRATELGYWKATGKERNVKAGNDVIGTKRTLVFHIGRAPKGERTEWIMHEYCMYGKSQDSLVVCRLRRNVEFRLNDNSNRSRRQMSASDRVVGLSEGDKGAECSRKCSSSYDSHSIEQFDSTSESEQKLSSEAPLAESSSHQQEIQDSDKEEDFYADILKDDIVKLDETAFSAAPELLPLVANLARAQTQTRQQQHQPQPPQPQQPEEIIMSQPLPSESTPSQGIANRRIKLKKQTPSTTSDDAIDSETKLRSSSKYVLHALSGKLSKYRSISLLLMGWTMLVLLVSLLWGSQNVKRNLQKALWEGTNE